MDATQAAGIPDGPISLPTDATFVSDADEEIFLVYTRLAALKPPDSNDTGHFHGLGSENSKEDSLLVRIELNPPAPSTVTTSETSDSEKLDNQNLGRGNRERKKKKKKKRENTQSRSGILIGPGKELEPVVLEYRVFQDITALRSRSGDTGSVLWKTRSCLRHVIGQKLTLTMISASSFCH